MLQLRNFTSSLMPENKFSVITRVKAMMQSVVRDFRDLSEMSFWVCIFSLTARVLSVQEPGEAVSSDGGGGLSLLRVAGCCGRGLSGKRVHGAQELIGDASGLAEPAEQGAVNRGRVVPDRVLPGEEETRHGLRGGKKKKTYLTPILDCPKVRRN